MYDRFAFGQGGHFFCRKEGETLNQNWIVENLNNAFSTWNGKLTELWGLLQNSLQKNEIDIPQRVCLSHFFVVICNYP